MIDGNSSNFKLLDSSSAIREQKALAKVANGVGHTGVVSVVIRWVVGVANMG